MKKIVINNERKEFDDIREFYKYIMNINDYNKIKIDDNDEYYNLLEFLKFYKSIKKECEESLNQANKSFLIDTDNKIVKESVNELIRMNSDGKFLRAGLIALGYSSINDKVTNEYLPLMVAYETFQTSILIHDDIIDNADLRRGKITIPKSYINRFNEYNNKDKEFEIKKKHTANSLGVCIGDLGFYLSSKIVIDNYCKKDNFFSILELYNKIVINTIKGEIIDVLLPFNEQYKKETVTTEKDILEIYKLKTAWYSIIGPYSLGMVLAGSNEEKIKTMEKVLYNLGLAFQIKDDILGVFGDEIVIGKSASSDISEFKQTILYSYIAENKNEYLDDLYRYYGKDNLTNDDLIIVKDIFTKSGSKDYAISTMEKLFNESKELLSKVDFLNDKYKSILYGFITYLDLRNK